MSRLRGQEGVTILEIVFATVILFFVVTAMLTTLNVATTLTSKSRHNTVATAIANREMEYARSIPYANVGVVGATGSEATGTLQKLETTSVQGFSFLISRNVVWVDDPADGTQATTDTTPNDYKRMTVTVSWNNPASKGRFTIRSNFRQPDRQRANPYVTLTSPSATATIVLLNPRMGGVPIAGAARLHPSGDTAYFRARATEDATLNPDGGIASVTFYMDGLMMRIGGGATTANYVPDAPRTMEFDAPSSPPGFTIDTLYTEPGFNAYADGEHELRVEVWNDSGLRDQHITRVFVDNHPPDTPGSVVATVGSTDNGRYDSDYVSWSISADGSGTAAGYTLQRNPINGGLLGAGLGTYYTVSMGSGISALVGAMLNDDTGSNYTTGTVRVFDYRVQASSYVGWTSSWTTDQRVFNGPGLAGYKERVTSQNRRMWLEWGDKTWGVASYPTTLTFDLAYSANPPAGSLPNMFTNPPAATTILPWASVATSATLSTTLTAGQRWMWKSEVYNRTSLKYDYVQLRANIAPVPWGSYSDLLQRSTTLTVYSNVLQDTLGTGDGVLPDNPYTWFW